MNINANYEIIKKVNGNIEVIDRTHNPTIQNYEYTPTSPFYDELLKFYVGVKGTSPSNRNSLDTQILESVLNGVNIATTSTAPTLQLSNEELVERGLENLMKFFTEFQFEPNFRFVNTLALALANSKTSAKTYVGNYFELIDSPYAKDIIAKVKSAEFKNIMDDIKALAPTKTVNNRFKLYYGSQGTGKTTIAMKETNGKCMVCNNSMLPSDLMEDFVFVNGQATFQPSALYRSMVEGTPIVLDEINLLPFDSLRFLQTILDGKKEFLYKDYTVKVADGFKIIGTMNLVLNGMVYGLPEPLVDRAETTEKFSLTAKDLLGAII